MTKEPLRPDKASPGDEKSAGDRKDLPLVIKHIDEDGKSQAVNLEG